MMDEPLTARSTQSQLLWALVQDMAELKATIKMVHDHEERIRELEKARWQTAWITALASAAATAILVSFIMTSIGAT
jgi:type IV secretory pathway component VirB8